jgi:hypothetical protein
MTNPNTGTARYELTEGQRGSHERAITMLWARAREIYPTARREERYISGFADIHKVQVEYPFYGKLVLEYVAAPHNDVVYVWDLWPADSELPELVNILDMLDPRAPDLATRLNARPIAGPAIPPLTLYFPRNPRGIGGYWTSVFNADDWQTYLPSETPRPQPEPGIVYYQLYRELSEPPYLIDAFEPAALEVPAPGLHPDPTAWTAGSLFPAPIRVSEPGVLPTSEQRRAARRVISSPKARMNPDQ